MGKYLRKDNDSIGPVLSDEIRVSMHRQTCLSFKLLAAAVAKLISYFCGGDNKLLLGD
jgi:hypothetical protein